MKKILVFLPFLWFASEVLAQTQAVDLAMMQKIRTEELAHSDIPKIAHELTDLVGPRLTGSPGFDRACTWAIQTMKQWGLDKAEKESWGTFGRGWGTQYVYAALTAPYYQPLIIYPRAWTPGTPGKVSGRVVFIDQLDSASIDKAGDVNGAIVLIRSKTDTLTSPMVADATRLNADSLDHMPDTYMLARQLIEFYAVYLKNQNQVKQYLHKKGALALLSMDDKQRDGTIIVDGDLLQATGKYPAVLPEAVLATEDYLRLQRLDAAHQPANMELDLNNKWYGDNAQGYNVVAEIPGTDPTLGSQVVMLGGHLDSWHSGTGATDNGAGCIVMMEVVRLFKTLGIHPRRTIRIALWGGEEEGLLGSFGYVKKHLGNPADMKLTEEQKKISAYFNLDNGTGKIRGIYLQNNEAARPIFKSWLAPFADLGATGITSSNTGSTDHLSFDAVGIPGFQFIQDPLDYETRTHHSNMDLYDHLSIPDLEQAAIVVAGFVYDAAMQDDMIPRKPLPAPGKFLFDFDGLF